MKGTVVCLSLLIISTFLCSYVSSNIIVDGFNANQNLSLILTSTNTSYVTSESSPSSVPNDRTLLFSRYLNIALTSNINTSSTAPLQMTFTQSTDGATNTLDLSTPSHAGGVFTLFYGINQTVLGDATTFLPPECTSSLGNTVYLDSEACLASPVFDNIIQKNPIDLTSGGSQFAFNIPLDVNITSAATYEIVLRIWYQLEDSLSTDYLTFNSSVSESEYNGINLDFGSLKRTANSSIDNGGEMIDSYNDWSAIRGLALQFNLPPSQNVVLGALQVQGVTITKNAILRDINFDGIANPGEQIDFTVVIDKPALPPRFGSWAFNWNDTLSYFLEYNPGSIASSNQGPDAVTITTEVNTTYDDQVDYNRDVVTASFSVDAGTPGDTYTVSFSSTVSPTVLNTVFANGTNITYSFVNVVDLQFILYPFLYDLNAQAPRIQVGELPEAELTFVNCQNNSLLVHGQPYTFQYEITDISNLADIAQVTVTQYISPIGVITDLDPNWSCANGEDYFYNPALVCTITIVAPPNFGSNSPGLPLSFSFNVSETVDCNQENVSVTFSTLATDPTGRTGLTNEFTNQCPIRLVPNVNLAVQATALPGNSSVSKGDDILYSIVYNNTGSSTAYGITLIDVFPPNTYPIIPPGIDWVCDSPSTSNTCFYNDTQPLASGESRLVLIALSVGENYTRSSICTDIRVTSSNPPGAQFCATSASTTDPCIDVVNPVNPTPSSCPSTSVSPSPCVYCLTGSTINISMKSLIPQTSSSCANGSCKRK